MYNELIREISATERLRQESTETYYSEQADIACELASYANRFCSSFDDEWN